MSTTAAPPVSRVDLPARLLTLDDVSELAAADETHRYELVEGALVVMPPADAEHSALIMRLGAWLLSAGCDPYTVLATPGLRISGKTSGRIPDLVVLRTSVARQTVWLDPGDVLVVVEVVSPGSEKLDRLVKPAEYAEAGIPHYWRVERDSGPAIAHLHTLDNDDGEPAYHGHLAVLLDDLLAGPVPPLS
jgi:Uma2 family endonuclease